MFRFRAADRWLQCCFRCERHRARLIIARQRLPAPPATANGPNPRGCIPRCADKDSRRWRGAKMRTLLRACAALLLLAQLARGGRVDGDAAQQQVSEAWHEVLHR
jgi:hypothetical protein